jgi:hypothetical protein
MFHLTIPMVIGRDPASVPVWLGLQSSGATRLISRGWVSQSIIGMQGNPPSRGNLKFLPIEVYDPFPGLDVRCEPGKPYFRNLLQNKHFRHRIYKKVLAGQTRAVGG